MRNSGNAPPAHIILVGALGTFLCLNGLPRGTATAKHVQLATLDEVGDGAESPWELDSPEDSPGALLPDYKMPPTRKLTG